MPTPCDTFHTSWWCAPSNFLGKTVSATFWLWCGRDVKEEKQNL